MEIIKKTSNIRRLALYGVLCCGGCMLAACGGGTSLAASASHIKASAVGRTVPVDAIGSAPLNLYF